MNQLRMSQEQADAHQKRVKGEIADVVADLKAPITNKFGAVKTRYEGIDFDSKHEAECYMKLRADELAGLITELRHQVPIQVHVGEINVFTYIADFRFICDGVTRYQDAKGYRKGSAYQLFKLKQKVIAAAMGIDVEEV